MTVENDFLPFATGAGANVIDQPTYAALAALAGGFQAGTAQSAQLNKVWRQSSIMAAVLAQFIVAQTGQAAIDDGTTAMLLSNLTTGVDQVARTRLASPPAIGSTTPAPSVASVNVTTSQLAIPGAATGAGSTTGGALPAATWYVKIVAVDSLGGTTTAGAESIGVATTGAASSIAYAWPAVPGAASYQIWYGTAAGAEAAYYTSATNSFTLAAAAGTVGTIPNTNTTGGMSAAGPVAVPPATQRQHAVQMAQIQTQAGTAFTTAGVAPNFTLTPAPAVQSLVAPLRFRVKFHAAGTTGSNTLNINGLGAVALMQYGPGGVLQPAVIPSGLLSDVEYNGMYCVVLDPVTAGLVASGITTVNATGALTASVGGGTVIGNSSSATTQTLPAASTLPAGVQVEFLNINTGAMTVSRAGADTITVNNTTVTTLALGNGDTLTLESNGANGWYAVAGSAQLQYAAIMQSVQSLGTSGYRKIPAYPGDPSPLIIQWGLVASSTSGAAPATFPIAFPTACYGVTLGTQYGSGSPAISQLESAPSTTGFTFGMWVSGSRIVQSASYFAFGK